MLSASRGTSNKARPDFEKSTIVDSTFIEASSSTKKERDPKAYFSKKAYMATYHEK